MSRRNQRLARMNAPVGSRPSPIGIQKVDGQTIAYSLGSVPAAEHFFYATHAWVERKGGELFLFFGELPHGEEGEFTRQIQIVFPLHSAKVFLFAQLFEKNDGPEEASFSEKLKRVLVRDADLYGEQKAESLTNKPQRPKDRAQFRMFASNFSSFSYSAGQGMIEFFEAPPDTIANLIKNAPVRPGAGIKSIVSILMGMPLLDAFLDNLREVIAPLVGEEGVSRVIL